ncbi:MAG TPA: hypothetical protein ENK91_05695 [Bacteroidetes bacterium]|nr:hypothetical protein [Bacteroidota bacterium]
MLAISVFGTVEAQITQTIRGKVVDSESNFPLIGVNIVVLGTDPMIGAVTDINGDYRLNNVPIGRHSIEFSYIGYKDVLLNDVIVTSGKEVILNVKMEETVTKLEEVVIVGKKSGDALNEMAVLSAREFSVYETEKYAGSRGEPARMARNYAGVLASDDSRNDIVIRGNTPTGVLWKLEGINIPNPNHFAIPGTGGGPVTILNNKFLSNSDFFTGAFPAEYANGIAGVFDLKMRNGNNEKYEGSVQFGFLGTELMAEGPINKKKGSSFLAMYRYSTVSIFKKLGIDLGTTSEPVYQDGAFRFNFPLKKGGNIALFGIGGKSNAPIVLSTQLDTSLTELYGSNDRDQYFGSRTGIVGLSYTKAINPKTFVKAVFSASQERVTANHDKIVRHTEGAKYVVDTLINILDYVFRDNKYSAYFSINKKYSRRLSMKAGLNFDMYDSKYIDSVRVVYLEEDNVTLDSITPWRKRWDGTGKPMLIQPYVQLKFKASDKLTLTGGLTSLFYTMSKNSYSPIEPRLGLSYQINKKQKINFATGLHSQILAPYLYYYDKNDVAPYKDKLEPYNKDLKLMKSLHLVAGYERFIGKNIRFKAETYYQYLYDLPVELHPSSYSLINSGTGFSRFFPDTLTSKGTGRNYGLDLTLEKAFSNGYFFMTSGSIFDSKYRGSDDTLRNTSFNGRFAANLLFGKEFKIGYKQTLNIGFKVSWTGGQRYGIIDKEESQKEQEIVYADTHFNDYQFKDYFRADLKIAWKLNTSRFTHEIALDVANLLNTKNVLRYSYAPGRENPILEEYQLGRLPIFYYRFDF